MNTGNSPLSSRLSYQNTGEHNSPASSTSSPDAEQNKKVVQLVSEDPIFIPHDDGRFEDNEDARGNFWSSWLAHAAWIIPALFLARWFLISFFGGHAPDYDFVIHWIEHLGK